MTWALALEVLKKFWAPVAAFLAKYWREVGCALALVFCVLWYQSKAEANSLKEQLYALQAQEKEVKAIGTGEAKTRVEIRWKTPAGVPIPCPDVTVDSSSTSSATATAQTICPPIPPQKKWSLSPRVGLRLSPENNFTPYLGAAVNREKWELAGGMDTQGGKHLEIGYKALVW